MCTLQPAAVSVNAPAGHAAASSATDAEDQSDLLQNLLGVSDAQALDKMLDSADNAAALLGVEPEQNSVSSVSAADDMK